MGELLSMALKRTIDRALHQAKRTTEGMDPADVNREARRAGAHGCQALFVAFMDSWGAVQRSRDQREASAVRTLRPWLEEPPPLTTAPDQSSQSTPESADGPSIKNNPELSA
ncbi:MAG: hypothetical protein IT299_04595 [Dehalococcoidia bacterium]|nr:hypothetical protein [Dehalococcoidia bacterium]